MFCLVLIRNYFHVVEVHLSFFMSLLFSLLVHDVPPIPKWLILAFASVISLTGLRSISDMNAQCILFTILVITRTVQIYTFNGRYQKLESEISIHIPPKSFCNLRNEDQATNS